MCCLPTPIHRLDWLSGRLQVDLWIKRDDLTGFAFGGNKGRKLEYILADAIASRAEVITSCGASQSNFVRQLGAACARFGIECHAAVMDCPYEGIPGEGTRLLNHSGNILLDHLFGVKLHRYADSTWDDLYARTEEISKSLEKSGKRVYRVPVGGSCPLGAYSFWEAARELRAQTQDRFDYVVMASSSGSTHVGLHAGLKDWANVIGIAADPEPEIVEDFAELSQGLSLLYPSIPTLSAGEFELKGSYVGKGYSILDEVTLATIMLVAEEEGIILDPVYTGKAMTGLMDLVQTGEIGGRILFWHTGGTPTVFAVPKWPGDGS